MWDDVNVPPFPVRGRRDGFRIGSSVIRLVILIRLRSDEKYWELLSSGS